MKRSVEGFNGISFGDEEESKVEKLNQKKLLNELLELQKLTFYLCTTHYFPRKGVHRTALRPEASPGLEDFGLYHQHKGTPMLLMGARAPHPKGVGPPLPLPKVAPPMCISNVEISYVGIMSIHCLVRCIKDFVSKKRKLQAAKLKKENILGEILFLKQRRRYLLKSQSSDDDNEKNISHLKEHFDAESEVPKVERSNNGYDAVVESARPAFTSKFNSEHHEVGCEELLAGGDVLRMECVPKNYKEETLLAWSSHIEEADLGFLLMEFKRSPTKVVLMGLDHKMLPNI
ncbi:hypothetical protein KY289_034623 [Solanum tuberosum]|nr:hypothetical protein KY289_034623 [Solanum tuberosum]